MIQKLFVAIFSICVLISNSQKIVFPFKNTFSYKDTLLIKGVASSKRFINLDTVFGNQVLDLKNLKFLNKKIVIENYGVTPQYSISIYKKNKRLTLMSCWNINENEYGVNISINDKFEHYGLVISKQFLNMYIFGRE